MKTLIALIVTAILLIALGTGYYMFNRKVPGLENIKPDFTLSADELYDEFERNEEAAFLKYGNKVILVTGVVESVKENDSLLNIIVKADNALTGGVNCSFSKKITRPVPGDKIEIKGRCIGLLMDVIMNNCTLK